MRKLQDLVPNMDKVAVICLFRIVELASLRVNYIRLNNWLNKLTTYVSLQQTNTSDMLDLAVEYIKDLQNQVKVMFNIRFVIEIRQTSLEVPHLEKI